MDARWRLVVTTPKLTWQKVSCQYWEKLYITICRQQRKWTLLCVNGFSLWSQEICLVSLKCPGEEGQLQVSSESMSRVECRVSISVMIVEGWRASQWDVDALLGGCIINLRGVVGRDNSLACSPGTRSLCSVGQAFVLFGRLHLGLRGAGVPNKLAQELELGQEELPDYIPTWKARRSRGKMNIYSRKRWHHFPKSARLLKTKSHIA